MRLCRAGKLGLWVVYLWQNDLCLGESVSMVSQGLALPCGFPTWRKGGDWRPLVTYALVATRHGHELVEEIEFLEMEQKSPMSRCTACCDSEAGLLTDKHHLGPGMLKT